MTNSIATNTTIFTDGSSRGNPGRGGWGAVLVQNVKIKTCLPRRRGMENEKMEDGNVEDVDASVTELGGHEKMTTNNRMELTACLNGLVHAPKEGNVTVYTDSSYVINGITKWINGWKRNGWLTKTKDEVLNKDLWEKLDEVVYHERARRVEWKYVGGHIGIVGNERCDHIATDFADGNEIKLYKGPFSGYDLPNILNISSDNTKATSKKSDSSRSRAKAYSYISRVDGTIEVHHSWAECESRVKGMKGARYKKSLNIADESEILREFEAL